VVSHYHQARAAALMVLDILHNGRSPGSIPVTDKSPNVCMFDASLMARWHLDPSRLPSGAELVNPLPHSFTRILSDPRAGYAGVAIALAGVAAVIILFRRRRRMQRMDVQNRLDTARRGMQDSRDYLKSIMDSLPEALVLLDCDGRIVDWNRNAEQWATVPGKLGAGKDFFSIFSSLPLAPSRFDLVLARREAVHISNTPVMLGGVAVYADILVCPVRASDGDRVLVRCADVSGQVRVGQYLMGAEWLFSLGGTVSELTKTINSPLSAILLDVQNVHRRLGDRLPENEETAQLCGTTMEVVAAYCERRGITGMLAGIREASETMVKVSAEISVFVNEERNELSSVNFFELVHKAANLAATETRMSIAGKEKGIRFVITEEGDPEVLFVREELELALLCFFRWHGRVCADVWQQGELELAVTASASRDEIEVAVCNSAMEYSEHLRMLPEAFAQRRMRLVPYMGAELTLVYLLFILRHSGALAVQEHPDGGVVTTLRLPTGN
ncbi:MAG: PAS domain-containing protein, partial [Halodesulfovibrio sp.]